MTAAPLSGLSAAPTPIRELAAGDSAAMRGELLGSGRPAVLRGLAPTSNGASALDVVGMPAMKGRVMVIDPSGVKDLGLLFGVLGSVLSGTGDINDLTNAQLDSIGNAGSRTRAQDTTSTTPHDNRNPVITHDARLELWN